MNRQQSTMSKREFDLQRIFSGRVFTKAKQEEEPAITESPSPTTEGPPPQKKKLSLYELLLVLRPFFWPAAATDGAVVNRFRVIMTWVFVGASKGCSLASPVFLASAVNYLVSGDMRGSFDSIIAYSMLRLASAVFKEFQSIIYIRVNQQASIELQELTFAHLHSLSLHWHVSKKTGNVVRVMDRGKEAANTLVTYLFLYLLPALAECLAVVVLFFAQFSQWSIGALVLGGVTMYCLCTIRITLWRAKFREKTNNQDNDFHYKSTDSILNYETVKYFTNEVFEINRFKESVVKYQKYNSATQFSLSFLNITQQVILNGTVLGTGLISAVSVIHGDLTLGAWVGLLTWVNQIFVPLGFLGSVYGAIVQALVDVKNLSELLSESPDVIDSPGAIPIPLTHEAAKGIPVDVESGVIPVTKGVSVEFRNIFFHYPTQEADKGLQDVNILVKAGTTTAIVGHTGAGKTTISRLLFRFYDPQGGAVLLDGKDIRQFTQQSVRQAIGVVPQDTVLFNDTLLHNIKYGRMSATMEEVEAAAEAAQIRSFIESLPDKWKTSVGERGLKLSGGEKQRVAIARCLLKDPPVVLLDEATSALDTVTESSIQDALWALGKNRTVLIIAHRLSTIKQADQIVVLDKGHVGEVGTHEELLEKGGLYARLWNMQLRPPGSVIEEEGEATRTADDVAIAV